MKVLLYYPIRIDRISPEMVSDLSVDCLGLALRRRLGNDFVEFPRNWSWYKGGESSKVWGGGHFTNFRLPDDNIDRSEIDRKIFERWFDYIIIPRHHTIHHDWNLLHQYVDALVYSYGKDRVIVVDGHDTSYVDRLLAEHCIYFKRELEEENIDVCRPLPFAVPDESIVDARPPKSFDICPLIPCNQSWNSPHFSSYQYRTPDSFRDIISSSWFTYCCKKAGWWSAWPIEIVSYGSVPLFMDIERSPNSIFSAEFKELCAEAKRLPGLRFGTTEPYDPYSNSYLGDTRKVLPGEQRGFIDWGVFDVGKYESLRCRLVDYVRTRYSSSALAEYFLGEIGC